MSCFPFWGTNRWRTSKRQKCWQEGDGVENSKTGCLCSKWSRRANGSDPWLRGNTLWTPRLRRPVAQLTRVAQRGRQSLRRSRYVTARRDAIYENILRRLQRTSRCFAQAQEGGIGTCISASTPDHEVGARAGSSASTHTH
jgi:hypothetical protein